MEFTSIVKLDWFQFTTEKEAMHVWLQPAPSWPVEHMPRGYDKTVALRNGGTMSLKGDQEVHYVLTGSSLADYRNHYSETSLLAAANNAGVRNVSRLDIACDVMSDELLAPTRYSTGDFPLASRMRLNAEFRTPTTRKNQSGETVYFGSPRSKKRLVIYDKAAQQKVEHDLCWTRYEIRLRNQPATNAFFLALEHGVSKTFSSLLAKMGTSECPVWQNLVENGDTTLVPKIPRKESSYHRWLTEQVAASIIKNRDAKRADVNAFLAILAKEGII